MTLDEIGMPISGLPSGLRFSRPIEEFDGPILSEYRSGIGGGTYVEKWCAQSDDSQTQRSIIVRCDQRSIVEYIGGRISMLSMLRNSSDGICLIVDRRLREGQPRVQRVAIEQFDRLPGSYLPQESVMYDASLRPQSERGVQSFLLPANWSGELIATVERSYRDVCAMRFLAADKRESGNLVPESVMDYEYRGGYPVANAFRELQSRVPRSERTVPTGIAAASPGVMSIEAGYSTALDVARSLRQLERSLECYQVVHKWAKQEIDRSPSIPTSASADLQALIESLHLDQALVTQHASKLLPLAKLICSYHRKLRTLSPTFGLEFIDGLGHPDVGAE